METSFVFKSDRYATISFLKIVEQLLQIGEHRFVLLMSEQTSLKLNLIEESSQRQMQARQLINILPCKRFFKYTLLTMPRKTIKFSFFSFSKHFGK